MDNIINDFNPCKGMRIRNPENFCLWNPEYWALEYGIQLMQGIRNPSSTDKNSGIQYLESRIHGVESRIQECLGFPYIGRNDWSMVVLTSGNVNHC